MPRDLAADSDKFEHPRRRGRSPFRTWLLLAVLGSLILGCGAGFVCGAAWIRVTDSTAARTAFVSITQTMSRKEFDTRMIGKTHDDVVIWMGVPDLESSANPDVWVFKDRTIDPSTGRTDPVVVVRFVGDRVVSVSYP